DNIRLSGERKKTPMPTIFTWRRRPPIVVVLGGGILEDGTPSQETLLRAQCAADLVKKHPEIQTIILSGRGPLGRFGPVSEARVLNEPGGIEWAHRFYADIKAGDLPTIIARLSAYRPYYATLPWLTTAAKRCSCHRPWWHGLFFPSR